MPESTYRSRPGPLHFLPGFRQRVLILPLYSMSVDFQTGVDNQELPLMEHLLRVRSPATLKLMSRDQLSALQELPVV